ncbi:MAG: translation initiation factor IF-2 [Thermoleophilia bacterium]
MVIDAQAGRRGAGGGPGGGRGPRGGGRGQGDRDGGASTATVDTSPVEIASGATVKDVAEALSVSSAQIIKVMMGMGELVTLTQSLSDEAIELLAEELDRKVTIVHAEDEAESETFEDAPEDLVARAPVVTIMGHVDHGKTSLLDAIRTTEVAAGEAGGITQHIGAYQVHHGDREITFLDTPGHEAFTAMRARGAKITDVAVIVVAADDGVMPQTLEAIDHARAAEVPFLVAVNKIDKAGANPDRVRQELSQREVIPAEWGGTHEFVNVSALDGTGLESLLETVLLVADADAEPKGNPNAPASGTVIESRLDPGRGPVCTLLVQRGTLRVGDVIIAGEHYGRVRAMNDFNGEPVTEATPSEPAEILGLSGVPDAGDKFRIVDNERTARQMASERSQRLRAEELANRRPPVSLDDLFARIKEGGLKELNIIVKGDVQGSVGALVDALNKVEQTEVRLNIIHTGVGAITESDVNLASASEAIIIGFNVRPRPEAKLLGEREGVDIRTYRVIYRAIEDVRDALVGLLEPDIVEDVIGQAEVRATFRSSRLGTIAGCYVTDGIIRRSAQARLLRDGTVVHEGRIGSLRRVNDDVREVLQGFECGILLEDYNDVKDGDTIEVFELREVARTSQAPAADSAE